MAMLNKKASRKEEKTHPAPVTTQASHENYKPF